MKSFNYDGNSQRNASFNEKDGGIGKEEIDLILLRRQTSNQSIVVIICNFLDRFDQKPRYVLPNYLKEKPLTIYVVENKFTLKN
jgi:hypothetical protein